MEIETEVRQDGKESYVVLRADKLFEYRHPVLISHENQSYWLRLTHKGTLLLDRSEIQIPSATKPRIPRPISER